MTGGIITTGSITRLLQDGVKNVFGDAYNDYPMECKKLFDEESSKKAYELDVQYEGFGLASRKPEGDAVQYDSAVEGFTPKYINYTYAKGIIVTKEAQDDNQYGLFKSKAKRLARSMLQTQETVAANVYNRAFTSTYTMLGGDGQELLATDHINGPSDSTTYSNMLAVPASLSESSIESLLIQIAQATDPRGLKIALKGQRLIVPSALGFEAERILKSVLQNDTANNAVNAIKSTGILPEYVINHYLSSSTAWFIKTDCPDGLKFMNRQAVEFDQDMDFGTSDSRYKATQRYSFGWTDPRGLYGSAGA